MMVTVRPWPTQLQPVLPLAKILRAAAFQPLQLPATAKMPRPLTLEQLLTPVPSDIAISDAIAPLPIREIAHAAGIVRLSCSACMGLAVARKRL